MKTSVQKGKILEKYVADQIREKGIDLKAYPSHGSGNGNSEKGDIWTSMMVCGQNAGIECKNHSKLCIQEWWKQTKKLESLRREPILAFKIYGEPLEETKVIIYLDTFLELVKGQGSEPVIVTGESQHDREKKWAIQALISAAKKLLKIFDEE